MRPSLAERLRDIVRASPRSDVPLPRDAGGDEATDSAFAEHDRDLRLADSFGGCWAEARGQRYLVVDRSYSPGYRHGGVPLMDAMPPWPRLPLLGAGGVPGGKSLFIDIETTGLGGGAGTYAFLIGCGWFDGPTFRVRQFVLSAFAGEAALLDGVADLARDAATLVSFNGKSFDLPLLETRYQFHRMRTPFGEVPHIDMLHPARRLWRPTEALALAGCRLSVLERTLCGVERCGDVPGFEIPSRYFAYVRGGDPRPLEPVLEHNRLDLVSLALLTARASRLLDEGPAATRSSREALGVGRLYERGELYELACDAYRRATQLADDGLACAEALRSLAILCRRLRRYREAANAWHRLLELRCCPPHIVREATQALAIHHEHRMRDLCAARQFALQSLRLEATTSRQHAVRHRLARLERKLAGPTTEPLRF